MIILIDAPVPDAQAAELQRLSPKIKLVKLPQFGKSISPDLLRDAEVIYTTQANFDPNDAPRLRWVQSDTAATNPLASKPIVKSSIPIANVSGAYTPAVVECAFAMLLALTRRVTLGLQFQRDHRWPTEYEPWQGEDLYGKTVGIVGYGSIGRHFARVATALGMDVLACKRRPEQRRDDSFVLPNTGDPEGRIPKQWFGQDQMQEMFAQSDIVLITLPDVPTTRNLIGKSELAALPRHATFVNIGRGGVIDEPALVDALVNNRIAGAALDVFAEEPLPTTSPLWKMSNVVIMPHIASYTTNQAKHASMVLVENVRRDQAGESLINLIDKELLY